MVGDQSLFQRLDVIVCALDESFARNIVGHGFFGRMEDLVVRAPRGRVDQSACDAGYEDVVGDQQLNCLAERLVFFLQHLVELFCLFDRSGKAIQNEAKQDQP